MKVGIVTLLGNNYGGALQAYALNRQLKKMGADSININYKLDSKLNAKDLIKKMIYFERNKKFDKFRKQNLTLSLEKTNNSSIDENEFQCDAYIAGSDQIWNQQIPMEQRKIYYLDFVKKSKKIAYAASIGRDNIEENEKKQISKYLDDFDYISIRENTGVNLYQSLTKNKIENVLDPTLLINSNEWDDIAILPKINKEYAFVYTLGANNEVIKYIDEISKKLDIGIVEISYKKNFIKELKSINNAGPKEFVGLIKNSKYVITNSFHGMVFSIIYKKDFWVFTRGKMNSRIYDLLKIVKLENRIIDIDNINSINDINLNSKIDYDKVHKLLEKEKEKSTNFLKKALNI